ncbi:YbaK/EbsC family protein [Flexivirga aerilata]|nr:YbaK/EbsC family protein [Flexivirga aerilata]
MSDLPARSQQIQQLLAEHGVPGQIRVLPESSHTAAQAAAALGTDVGAIASSLVFLADDRPLLVMTSGAHRVDTAMLGLELGQEITQAAPNHVKQVTGQPIGGVSPIGHPEPLRTIVDSSLQAYDELWAAGGTPNTVFPISYADLLRITGGTPMRVAPA